MRLAVDLRRRRDDDQLLLLRRGAEHDLGGAHVRLDRVYRPLDDELHADGRREVDTSRRRDRPARDTSGTSSADADAVVEALAADQVRDVLHAPVERSSRIDDAIAALEQPLGEVGSDEPAPPVMKTFTRPPSPQVTRLRAFRLCRARCAAGERCRGTAARPRARDQRST